MLTFRGCIQYSASIDMLLIFLSHFLYLCFYIACSSELELLCESPQNASSISAYVFLDEQADASSSMIHSYRSSCSVLKCLFICNASLMEAIQREKHFFLKASLLKASHLTEFGNAICKDVQLGVLHPFPVQHLKPSN